VQAPELRDAATKAETVAGMRARAALQDLHKQLLSNHEFQPRQ
jgi:hypothetical protein